MDYISRGHQLLHCLGVCRIFQVPKCQEQSAYDAFIMSVIAHPNDIIPRRGLITGAKIQIYFEMSKSIYRKIVTNIKKHKWNARNNYKISTAIIQQKLSKIGVITTKIVGKLYRKLYKKDGYSRAEPRG